MSLLLLFRFAAGGIIPPPPPTGPLPSVGIPVIPVPNLNSPLVNDSDHAINLDVQDLNPNLVSLLSFNGLPPWKIFKRWPYYYK